MRLFYELSLRAFQRQLVYRNAALAGLATNFFFGIIRIAVLVALYGARQEVAGISLQGAITFTGLSQSTIGVLSLFGWTELMNNVYTGGISSDLLKPISLFRFWLAQDLGRAAGQFLLRGLPMMVSYAVFFGITTPSSPGGWLAFSVSLFLAWLLSFSWRFLINLSAFWVPNALGVARFGFTLSWFLSGFLMPLRFFPRLVHPTLFIYTFPGDDQHGGRNLPGRPGRFCPGYWFVRTGCLGGSLVPVGTVGIAVGDPQAGDPGRLTNAA